MTDGPRLIERGFPLRQASIDSLHEKSVRHGHISTLHIWPARRPLAACRAALIATLLPDPGNAADRARLLERIGGRLVKRVKTKKLPDGRVERREVEETEGGVLHWGRERGADLDWFREEIRRAYGGRAPKVLDPFAGGGAIPLEAMRLGCEATAVDINPVAWFIEKCTLEYPQRLAGQRLPLPRFALESPEFMAFYHKETGKAAPTTRKGTSPTIQQRLDGAEVEADLAWHVRAWGWWVLQRAKRDLARYYPTVDGKPTVAYLWARTVRCKSCRALVPLLKTRWLCKKDRKRVLLTMEPRPEEGGVAFDVQRDVPVVGASAAARREHDKRLGTGTMTRVGATCPCCGVIMTMEDIRVEGKAGRLGAIMTAVVVDGAGGKEYRRPTDEEIHLADETKDASDEVFKEIPFGLPTEMITEDAKRNTWCVAYGVDRFSKLFTPRQLLALGTFVLLTRDAHDAMRDERYPLGWVEAIAAYLGICVDRLADYNSSVCHWHLSEYVVHTFQRFALPMAWDYCEIPAVSTYTGGFPGAVEWVSRFSEHALWAYNRSPCPAVRNATATSKTMNDTDVVVTDPPYYDAIGYSVLMDFFYVWLRRTLHGLSQEIDAAFAPPLAPKWDRDRNDGELIDDSSRFGGNKAASKAAYEDGMARAFQACHASLQPDGRLVIVFAHKHPDAWETLVSAMIRAGFVVDGSWPIQTEMANRTRALSSAALSSSIWLVCKKRPGWDNVVLEEMRANIYDRLREFWDAGIRGPDFVWAATGPALEAYSKHPVVRKATDRGTMSVSEFLGHVRRIVVDFVVGRVLPAGGAAGELDGVTAYYLLHRHDFGMRETPAGACILYAVSCNLSDSALVGGYDLLARSGGQAAADEDEDEADGDAEDEGVEEPASGSTVKLKRWNQRLRPALGDEAPGAGPVPLVDQVHKLLLLWSAGDVTRVNDYLDACGLRRNPVFHQLVQALIELARRPEDTGGDLTQLELLSNHLGLLGVAAERQPALGLAQEGG